METPRTRQLRTAMELPLRDVLRGLHLASDLSGDMLRRAAPMLPPPLSQALTRSLQAPARAGADTPPPDAAMIARAAAKLAGTEDGSTTSLVQALGYAIPRVLDHDGADHLIFSETVARIALSSRVAGPGDAEHPADRAAAAVQALIRAHTVGVAPGLPLPPSKEIDTAQRHALVTAMLWLLTDRAETPAEEPRILELCAVLTRSMTPEIAADATDPAALAARLTDLARIV